MADRPAAPLDWATARRRRWSAPRIAAAIALHVLILASLMTAIERVEMPRRGADRATTLVTVALHAAPPPPLHPLPLPRTPPANARAQAVRDAGLPAPAPAPAPVPAPLRAPDDIAHAITLQAPPREPTPIAAATPPASSPGPDLSFLDNAATRQAIRSVARGDTDTLRQRGNALTREETGSELVAADGSHDGSTRNLPPPPPAQLLARNIAAAHKGDCAKGEYMGGGMGLLSAPFLIAAEAMGKCSSK
jgi:hypothetical protein